MSKCENMTVGIDHYAKLTNENAEMYAVLKVCKGYFEEMGLCEDSVVYKMICAALEAAEEANQPDWCRLSECYGYKLTLK